MTDCACSYYLRPSEASWTQNGPTEASLRNQTASGVNPCSGRRCGEATALTMTGGAGLWEGNKIFLGDYSIITGYNRQKKTTKNKNRGLKFNQVYCGSSV